MGFRLEGGDGKKRRKDSVVRRDEVIALALYWWIRGVSEQLCILHMRESYEMGGHWQWDGKPEACVRELSVMSGRWQ